MKVIGAGNTLVLGFAGMLFSTTSALAQSGDTPLLPASMNESASASMHIDNDDREHNSDWGWIGLLGLAGFIGLMPRKDKREDRNANDTSDIHHW